MILKKKSCINEFATILFQIIVKSEMFTKVDIIHYLFIIFNNFSMQLACNCFKFQTTKQVYCFMIIKNCKNYHYEQVVKS